MSGVWTIFRKELLDTLRDRKTLIFMLLIPTLAMPLLMIGLTRFFQNVQQAEQVRTVTIAADERTQELYRDMVHEWFLTTDLGRGLKIADTPILGALLKSDTPEGVPEVPDGITRDPAVFEQWLRDIAQFTRDNLDSVEAQAEAPVAELPEGTRDEIITFYTVAVKGLALVEFIPPGEVPDAPENWQPEEMPEELQDVPHIADIAWAINQRDVQGYMEFPANWDEVRTDDEAAAEILFVRDSTVSLSREALSRVRTAADNASDAIVQQRLRERDIAPTFLTPVSMRPGGDLATSSRVALEVAGSILPYLVIIFAFLGGLYPAIDLGAGEKERGTLETLLLSPASRTEIALGKFFVILLASLTAALLGVASLAVSVRFLVPPALLELFDLQIDLLRLLPVALLAIPPAAAFAGIFLALSIYARSFKEAQNYMAPLQFVLILPAIAPMVPGLEMSWRMALIPLVNVSMLSKDFLKGDVNWFYYGLTFASCAALAAACVAFCVLQFRREKVLFRS